jgi:hypothetical protein
MLLIKELLPDPIFPTMQVNVPFLISKLMFFNTGSLGFVSWLDLKFQNA